MPIAADPSFRGKRDGAGAGRTADVSGQPSRAFTASPDVVAVGKRIAYYRHQRSWTQDNLAFAAGISRPSIANLERGRYDAKLSTILDIADALKLDPRLLFSHEADPPDLKLQIAASIRDRPERKQCNACSRPAEERGLCPVHYRMWRAGDDTCCPDDPVYGHLSVDDAVQIRQLYASGQYSYRALARRWSVSHSTIRAVVLHQSHNVQSVKGLNHLARESHCYQIGSGDIGGHNVVPQVQDVVSRNMMGGDAGNVGHRADHRQATRGRIGRDAPVGPVTSRACPKLLPTRRQNPP